jgi:hypothetical protein
LEDALKEITIIANYVNEKMKENEAMEKLRSINDLILNLPEV